jgi:hypothetical protein
LETSASGYPSGREEKIQSLASGRLAARSLRLFRSPLSFRSPLAFHSPLAFSRASDFFLQSMHKVVTGLA